MPGHFSNSTKRFLIILAVFMATLLSAQARHAKATWTALAPVPSPTEGMTIGGVGQVIIGAYGFSSPLAANTNQTRLYNITSNTWSAGAAAPLPARSDAAYGETTHGGFLYVIGGGNSGTALSDVERYDPVLDSWTTLAPMPTARAGAAAAVIDDGIFVIGGRLSTSGPCSGGPYVGTVEKYDVDTGTWSTVAPLPSPRSDLAAVAHGGKVFVFGGCTGTASAPNVTNEVDMYDPETNTWTTLAPMPTPRASLVVGHSGNLVYAIGGTNGVSALNVNEVYDFSGNSWSTNTPMPTARHEVGVNSHGGRVYVVGGSAPAYGSSSTANQEFTP